MDITIVIPTKDRIKDIKECLESVANQSYPINSLIIVDGSENHETYDYVKVFNDKYKFINCIYRKQLKGGTANARNIGLDLADGDIVIFIDDDVILEPDCISEMISTFTRDVMEEIVGVGAVAKEEVPPNSIFKKIYSLFGTIFLRNSFTSGGITISGLPSRFKVEPSYVQWLDGKCMGYRKKFLSNFRFDEKLELMGSYAFYEDLDFSYNISKEYKLFINPHIKLLHKEHTTGHNYFKVYTAKIFNHYYLVKKHKFNKLAFAWSTLGLLSAQSILFILRRNKDHLRAIMGIFAGLYKIKLINISNN